MAKLVAIGDSITQGVMSGAISRTELSYPALIAKAMGLTVRKPGDEKKNSDNEFWVPYFPGSGIPINIEKLLQTMECKLGSDIEWTEMIKGGTFIHQFVNELERLYEEGTKSDSACETRVYHNLAVTGFRVFDSFRVHTHYCSKHIESKDNFLQLPSAPTYRIAQRVLNPGKVSHRNCWTQIDNLRYLNECKEKGPIENLILFLGANDCLQTVTTLKMKDMEDETGEVSVDPEERREKYNLTSTDAFEADYRRMVRQISDVISLDTKVFVGTVPHVTIPPVTRGISEKKDSDSSLKYYPLYGPFFADPTKASLLEKSLTRDEVKLIDKRVGDFNETIRKVIEEVPDKGKWHIVDICGMLDALAVKRQDMMDDPGKPLQKFLKKRDMSNHRLLSDDLKPTPSVLRFGACDNRRTTGGLFSLDCIHPTTIGYGLIAEEFLRVMNTFCVKGVESNKNLCLDWGCIIEQDTLIQDPPKLWDDFIKIAEGPETLWNVAFYRLLPLITHFI